MLRLKKEQREGTLCTNLDVFPSIRLVDQTKQKFANLQFSHIRFGPVVKTNKPAPYLRLEIRKTTSKCQVFLYSTRKTQKLDRIGSLKGRTLWDFPTFLSQNIKKIEGGPFSRLNFSEKSTTMSKKTGRGPFSLVRYFMFAEKRSNSFG